MPTFRLVPPPCNIRDSMKRPRIKSPKLHVRARGLRAALHMLRPPHMAQARRFLLSRDSASDLGIISDGNAMQNAAVLSGECALAGGVGSGFCLESVFVPFLNIGTHNIGLVVLGTTSFNCPSGPGLTNPATQAVAAACEYDAEAVQSVRMKYSGDGDRSEQDDDGADFFASSIAHGACVDVTPTAPTAMPQPWPRLVGAAPIASQRIDAPGKEPTPHNVLMPLETARNFAVGRYCRDERSGELLYILSDISASSLDTVSVVWIGPPQGERGRVRERISVTCNASLFAAGALLESIMTSEYTVEVNSAGERPSILPSSAIDLSNNASNMESHTGSIDGYLVPRSRLCGRTIDMMFSRQIYSTSLESLTSDRPCGLRLRRQLVEIAVQRQFLQARPMPWEMSPVVELYMHALHQAIATINAAKHGIVADDLFYARSEADVLALEAASMSTDTADGMICTESPATLLESPTACDGSIEVSDAFAYSWTAQPVVREKNVSTDENSFLMSSLDTESYSLDVLVPSNQSTYDEEFADSKFAKKRVGKEIVTAVKSVVADDAEAESVNIKKQPYPGASIAPIKPTSTKRDDLQDDLAGAIELSRVVIDLLRKRQQELREEKSRLLGALLAA